MSRARAGLRERWTAEVLRSDRIGDSCRVLLLALAAHMTEAGSVSIPRDQMAAKLDRHPSRITERLTEAKRAGLLDQTGPGYRGRTATYVAVLPEPMVTGERSPLDRKGDGQSVTFSGYLSDPPKTATRPGKVTVSQSPNAGAHVRVSYGRRETGPNHDDSRDSLDHVLTERRDDRTSDWYLALAAAFSCEREAVAA